MRAVRSQACRRRGARLGQKCAVHHTEQRAVVLVEQQHGCRGDRHPHRAIVGEKADYFNAERAARIGRHEQRLRLLLRDVYAAAKRHLRLPCGVEGKGLAHGVECLAHCEHRFHIRLGQ